MPQGQNSATIHFVTTKSKRAFFIARTERIGWTVSQGAGVVFHEWLARGAPNLHSIENKLPEMRFDEAFWESAVRDNPELLFPKIDRGIPKTEKAKRDLAKIEEMLDHGTKPSR